MPNAKCVTCKKKVSNLMKEIHTCRCKNIYCGNHLHSHMCSFDYIEEYRNTMNMTKITPDKVKNKI